MFIGISGACLERLQEHIYREAGGCLKGLQEDIYRDFKSMFRGIEGGCLEVTCIQNERFVTVSYKQYLETCRTI